MQEFIALRKKARDIRDHVIASAREEYERTLVEIAKLEQTIYRKLPPRERKVSASIDHVIPADREFSTLDVMTALEALDPTRVWQKRAVANYICSLHTKGLIRRTKRHGKRSPAIYVRVGVDVPKRPFEDMTLTQVVAVVLGDRAMTPTELVVAMLEAGFDTGMAKKVLRHEVYMAMRNDPASFRRDGDKWSSVSA